MGRIHRKKKENMKNTTEIINQIIHNYEFNCSQNEFWLKHAEMEKNYGATKKAIRESESIAESYNERNNELVKLYAFVKEIGVMDACRELYDLHKKNAQ